MTTTTIQTQDIAPTTKKTNPGIEAMRKANEARKAAGVSATPKPRKPKTVKPEADDKTGVRRVYIVALAWEHEGKRDLRMFECGAVSLRKAAKEARGMARATKQPGECIGVASVTDRDLIGLPIRA